jgi:hypothetical protein
LIALLTSCDAPAPPPPPPGIIPSIDDFANFRDWTRTPIPSTDTFPHAIYSNALADQGPPYALGSAFVRAEEAGTPQTWLLHGIIDRGGDFNAGLATGWEFFGLFLDEHGTTRMIWRGEHPPLDAGYVLPDMGAPDTAMIDAGTFGLPAGDCNVCHRDPRPIIPYR